MSGYYILYYTWIYFYIPVCYINHSIVPVLLIISLLWLSCFIFFSFTLGLKSVCIIGWFILPCCFWIKLKLLLFWVIVLYCNFIATLVLLVLEMSEKCIILHQSCPNNEHLAFLIALIHGTLFVAATEAKFILDFS